MSLVVFGITKNQWRCRWIFGKRILAKSEVISWGIASLFTFYSNCVLAQITPDGTLGGEASVVTPEMNIKGLPADLILFQGRGFSELLSRSQHDRIVLRRGKPIDQTLPDYRELDELLRVN